MHVKDEQLWSDQLLEFDSDDMSRKFRDFLIFWLENTEDQLNSESEQTIRDSLTSSFSVAEQTYGYLSVEWIGQMLMVIVGHWVHGDEVWEGLSLWEKRLVEQSTAIRLAELQNQVD